MLFKQGSLMLEHGMAPTRSHALLAPVPAVSGSGSKTCVESTAQRFWERPALVQRAATACHVPGLSPPLCEQLLGFVVRASFLLSSRPAVKSLAGEG